MLNMLRQAFIGCSYSTLHDIFPAPPNMVTRLNNVMKTCVVQVNNTKPHTKLEDCLHLIVKFLMVNPPWETFSFVLALIESWCTTCENGDTGLGGRESRHNIYYQT